MEGAGIQNPVLNHSHTSEPVCFSARWGYEQHAPHSALPGGKEVVFRKKGI